MGSHYYEFQLSMGTLITISRYVNSAFRAAGLAAVVALGGCSGDSGNGSNIPPPKGTLEEKGISLTPDSSEVVTEMDESGEEISYAKDKVLVQVAAGTKNADLETLLQQVNGQITGHIQPLNWYEIQVQDAKTALPAIRQYPSVQNAELNYAGAVEELDVDAPGMSGFAEGYHKIKLSEAYGFIRDKNLANVTVAVLDSSFDLDHPELASQFLPGVDVGSVDNNPTYEDASENLAKARTHGTSVAGIIAMLNNGKDLNGVAYNAKILPVKVSASTPLGKAIEGAAPNAVFAFKVAAGITYAALEGADVINMSLGWHSSSPSWLLQSAVEYAQAEGVSLVASAGNENKDGTNHYPSVLNGVISVGATTEDDKRWTYSESTGSNYSLDNDSKILTVAAPGEDIWSAAAGERGELAITPGTGTSLAAPFVSGLDALVKSLKPSLSAEERQQIIIDSADEIKVAYPELDYPNVQGNKTWKRINAYNAVVLAETGCNPAEQDCDGDDRCEGLAPGAYEEWTVNNASARISDLALDAIGNIYVVGTAFIKDYDWNIWISKYDQEGNRLWNPSISVGGTSNDSDYTDYDTGAGIAVDPTTSNIYAIGTLITPGSDYYSSEEEQEQHLWIGKYDANSQVLWSLTYNNSEGRGNDIVINSVGDIYVTGYVVFGTGKLWINKYDQNKDQQWDVPIRNNITSVGYGITLDETGDNILVIGSHTVSSNNKNIWINKYDSNGNQLWNEPISYGGTANGYDVGLDIVVDQLGNIYATGEETVLSEGRNIWINKYDPDGVPLWSNPISYNGSANADDSGQKIAIDQIGDIYVVGIETVLGEEKNIWINKYDSNGNQLWGSPISYNGSANDNDLGTSIAIDSAGNIYAGGTEVIVDEGLKIWLRKYFQCN